jgi:hypothetical protein
VGSLERRLEALVEAPARYPYGEPVPLWGERHGGPRSASKKNPSSANLICRN